MPPLRKPDIVTFFFKPPTHKSGSKAQTREVVSLIRSKLVLAHGLSRNGLHWIRPTSNLAVNEEVQNTLANSNFHDKLTMLQANKRR
jgi:hypothetical protein